MPSADARLALAGSANPARSAAQVGGLIVGDGKNRGIVIPIMSLALRRHRMRNLLHRIEWHESEILNLLADLAEMVDPESDCGNEVRRMRDLFDQ